MSKEIDEFLNAEESATKLLDTLRQLKSEIESYETASEQLAVVAERLTKLIDKMESLASESNNVILTIKSIGGPKIFELLNNISNKNNETEQNIESRIATCKQELLNTINEDMNIYKKKLSTILKISVLISILSLALLIINLIYII